MEIKSKVLGVILGLMFVSSIAFAEESLNLTSQEWFDKGLNAYGQQKYGEAINCYTQAIKINPKYVIAYTKRGVLYCFKGNYDKAWDDVHKVESLGGQVPEFLLKALPKAPSGGTL